MSMPRRTLAIAVVAGLLATGASADTETIIQSVAGGGDLEGYAANDAAIDLANTSGIALHPVTGELYFSDTNHDQVYRVNPRTGEPVRVAGNGTDSFSGDGGAAVAAGVSRPGALAFSPDGSVLYVADNGNVRVRRIDVRAGLITTFAGNGLVEGAIPPGGGAPTSAGDGGPATSAAFGGTIGGILALSTGEVLLSDTANHYVRRVDVSGNIGPFAGTLDVAGSAGDGGPATSATLRNPRGLVIDTTGNVYVATQGGGSGDDRVRRIDTLLNISTYSGLDAVVVPDPQGDGGNADVARLGDPETLAYDATRQLLYVGSFANNGDVRVIYMAAVPPTITTLVGNGGTIDLGPAGGNSISAPGMAVDPAGNLYLAALGSSSIRRVDAATGFVDTVVGRTAILGQIGDRSPAFTMILESPAAMAVDDAGNLYVADPGSDSVRRVRADGTAETLAGTGASGYSGDGGPAFEATLNNPLDVEVVGTTLYIADNNNQAIRAVDLPTGFIRTFARTSSGNPISIAADGAGNLFATTDGNFVERISSTGSTVSFAGQNGAAPGALDSYTGPVDAATFSNLSGIAVAANGDVFVAEGNGGHRIRRLSADGLTTTRIAGSATAGAGFAGDGGDASLAQLDQPVGIAITPTGILVADSGNHRLRAIDLSVAPNIITTVAGDGTPGITGDGGPPASARVNDPQELVVHGGAILVADRGNNRVRLLTDAIIMDATKLAITANLGFRSERKTGLPIRGKDSLTVKAALPLPAGIDPATLVVRMALVDVLDQVQLDDRGRLPRPTRTPAAGKDAFDFPGLLRSDPGRTSRFGLQLRKVSTGTESKPTPFTWSGKGALADDVGGAGMVNQTTDRGGVPLSMRVNVGLGDTMFTGVATVTWKAAGGRKGTARPSR